jgi:dsDNA-specific endonuclease/ATPase MutS2
MSGVIAATAIAVGTVGSLYEGRRARKMSEKAMKVDEKRSKLQSMRSSVEQIRQAQIQRAQIAQMGENQNVASSSGVAGGMASVQSQATGNIAFAQQLFGLQQSYNRMQTAANKHSFNAQAWQALGSAASSMAMSGAFGSETPAQTDARLAAKHGIG